MESLWSVAVSSVYLHGFLWIHRGWSWHAECSWITCDTYLKCDYSDRPTYCDCICSFKTLTADFRFGRYVFALILRRHRFWQNLHFQMSFFFLFFFIKTDVNHCWQRPLAAHNNGWQKGEAKTTTRWLATARQMGKNSKRITNIFLSLWVVPIMLVYVQVIIFSLVWF